MSQLQDEISRLRQKINILELPPDLAGRVTDNLDEVIRMEGDITARVHIDQILRYIDWVTNLPWHVRSKDVLDLVHAREILDHNHFGLEPVKERILEYLAVLKLNLDRWDKEANIALKQDSGEIIGGDGKLSHAILARRAPILCLVGLVGTGKTTLAKSIAQAMGRRFIRIPFGGMSDALDLRGQARVRPDAEIGLVMKGLRYAGTKNPVILLDEIDRVAEHARGDIMGVLVELLDPEQNMAFTDHYLDYPFDLSEALFIATANNTTNIATAVLDRLEPIQMPSYSDMEKIHIAKDYVLPQLLKESGLSSDNLRISDDIWPKLVRPLGYDSGIRSLERIINGLCRRVARMIVEGKGTSFEVNSDNIKEYIQTY
jgi:ATP-dependent Lon protease